MSLFNWFSNQTGPAGKANEAEPERRHLPRDTGVKTHQEAQLPARNGLTKSVSTDMPGTASLNLSSTKEVSTQKAERKSKRHARRELLYVAIRESLTRAGVMSANYKFKVLSIDPRGEQFMVMMELAVMPSHSIERLGEIEIMMTQIAQSRFQIHIMAVYWRLAAAATATDESLPPGTHFKEAPRDALPVAPPAVLMPVAVVKAKGMMPAMDATQRFEVTSMLPPTKPVPTKKSEAKAVPSATTGSRRNAHSYTLLTGFEDTEMASTFNLTPALSPTQHGDLR